MDTSQWCDILFRLYQLRDQGYEVDGLIEQIEFWEQRIRDLTEEETDKETAKKK